MPEIQDTTSVQYDLEPLRSGPLFTHRFEKYYMGVFITLIVLGINASTLFQGSTFLVQNPEFETYLTYGGTTLFLGSVAAIFLYTLVWKNGFQAKLYRRSVAEFEAINNLQPVEPAELMHHIPPSLQAPGAYNQEAFGYMFRFGSTGVYIFDYSYSVGTGKRRKNYRFAISCATLSKEYPHLFLDGKANGANKNYNASQRIELEGDFNKYFDLYIPDQSQVGALTVFAPDVMQTLIEQGKPYDLEMAGYDVALITPGLAFTEEALGGLLVSTTEVCREFAHLEKSWRPVSDYQGKPFVLKKPNPFKAFLTGLVYLAILAIVIEIAKAILGS